MKLSNVKNVTIYFYWIFFCVQTNLLLMPSCTSFNIVFQHQNNIYFEGIKLIVTFTIICFCKSGETWKSVSTKRIAYSNNILFAIFNITSDVIYDYGMVLFADWC